MFRFHHRIGLLRKFFMDALILKISGGLCEPKKEEEPRGGSSIRGIGDGVEKLLDSDGGQRAVRSALESGDLFLQVAPRQDAA